MLKNEVHLELLRSIAPVLSNEHEALLWMTLLHTHEIHLNEPIIADCPNTTIIPALTQRSAAEVIARLWADRKSRKSDYTYWYFLWNQEMPYEDIEDAPDELTSQLFNLRDKLSSDSRVAQVVVEM